MVYYTYKYILPDLFGLSSSINCLASEGKWQSCLACRGIDLTLNQGLEQKKSKLITNSKELKQNNF